MAGAIVAGSCLISPSVAAQQAEGAAAYTESCASCHGEGLAGGFGPSLNNKAFKDKWGAGGPAAIRNYIGSAMPPSNPGGLSAHTYDVLAAFIAQADGLGAPPATPKGSGSSRTPTGHPSTGETPTAAPKPKVTNISAGIVPTESNTDDRYRAVLAARSAKLASLKTVSEQDLRTPAAGEWLSWRRTDDGFGFSPLKQIDRHSVGHLGLAWSMALPLGTNEIVPLVHQGVIFVDSSGTVLAIDAASGDVLWKYVRPAKGPAVGPPRSQPKSMAIFGDLLFVPTIDNHVIALDFRTGKLVWDHLITGMHKTLYISGGPIVVRGKVMQGMSGCSGVGEPGGCFIAALDALSGREVWRFNTIASPGTPNGDSWNGAPLDQRFGGSLWSPGTYDAADNLVLFGTGQTYHIATLMRPGEGASAANAGLYTDTTLALDPDTGALKWFYQHMARDVWDLDWSFERMVTTLGDGPSARRVVFTMGKIGILDVLDAKTGAYISSFDLGGQNLVTSIDPKTGWKHTDPALEPDPTKPQYICPAAGGVRNWPSTSYDPERHLLFIPTVDGCMEYQWVQGQAWDITYGLRTRPAAKGLEGGLAAVDLRGSKTSWWDKYRAPASTSALSTSGGLVFDGGRDRSFRASDSSNGALLWRMRLDDVANSTPVSFEADGEQYVAVTTGGGSALDATISPLTPEIEQPARSTTLWVFKLNGPLSGAEPKHP